MDTNAHPRQKDLDLDLDQATARDAARLAAGGLGSAEALAGLRRVLAAELAAAPDPDDPDGPDDLDDLEQAVWLRVLEHLDAGGDRRISAAWLRAAAREEAGRAASERRGERSHIARAGVMSTTPSAEQQLLDAELRRALRAAVPRLPGRCPQVIGALLSRPAPSYREMADELGISRGSIGPVRSRCLACLRRLLAAQGVAPGGRWGNPR